MIHCLIHMVIALSISAQEHVRLPELSRSFLLDLWQASRLFGGWGQHNIHVVGLFSKFFLSDIFICLTREAKPS